MGFLNNINKAGKDGIPSNWILLENKEQIDQALESSTKKQIAFFKHSTRCGISVQVKTRLEEQWDIDVEELDLYYLDLLSYRSLSDYIAEKTQVIHQSPQLIVVKDHKVIYNSSHFSINYDNITSLV